MKLAFFGGEPIRKNPYPIHTTIIDDAEEKAVISVLRGGHLSGFSARPGDRFLGGEKVREFESNLAEKFGVKYAITFNSATSALHGALNAIGIGPGDEVITSPYTMSASPSSILMTNGVPVFADIETTTFSLDPLAVEKSITPKTKAILSVNIFGHPSKLDSLKKIADENNLILLEDNSQSPGIKYKNNIAGTVGEIGILSLNYHKAIQTGEGGVALTNNADYAEHLQLIRNHAEAVVGKLSEEKQEKFKDILGWNYRLTEIQAAIGIEQLKKLDFFTKKRQELASYLTEKLSIFNFITTPSIRDGNEHGFYMYPMKFESKTIGLSREIFVKALQLEGISVAEGYLKPLYLEPIFQSKSGYGSNLYKGDVDYSRGICPNVELMYYEKVITTDICKYPNTKKDIDELIAAIEKIIACKDELINS